ncbi:uncharacterized protein E6C27_scaffold212G001170 [Cucumis melo var. makuwa]|uniref:Peptidase A1 domain-containing protein n=1 Tax=Cucumis melo var. makuwa TaxID=1194695 RepID=A0A5A7V0N4_CUCMM|nr:uncharacterized protein E6C27_scaffold212G001170 [Cucumis melo var. makuwa]
MSSVAESFSFFLSFFYFICRNAFSLLSGTSITSAVSQSATPTISRGSQCFRVSTSVAEIFPVLSFNFKGIASMVVTPEEYLQFDSIEPALWCIGFQKAEDGLNILGDLVLKDKIIVYDLARQRIGWANYDCSSSVNVSVTSGKDVFINEGQLSAPLSLSSLFSRDPLKGLLLGNGLSIASFKFEVELEIERVDIAESSSIHSNANLGVHGQGYLNLTGPGNLIEAQRLILSLFFSIYVGPKSFLRGPLDDSKANKTRPRLYCELSDCPAELLHPSEDCNVNSTLPFTLQICRVEDLTVEGTITGSVIHFHWVRDIFVYLSCAISASGLGCTGGVGRGRIFANGLGAGGGHGGKGGDGYYNGTFINGGVAYGDPNLPCELGSGSGNGFLII